MGKPVTQRPSFRTSPVCDGDLAPGDTAHEERIRLISVWRMRKVAGTRVEELLFERGVLVSSETIRSWCLTFGPAIAAALTRRRPQPTGTWHRDETFIKMPPWIVAYHNASWWPKTCSRATLT